jgi:hypothetical protein
MWRNMQEQNLRNQIIYEAPPLAMYPAYPSQSFLAGLDSQEMIPPLRGLSSMRFSEGDTFMTDAESILGKRPAEQQEGESEDRSRAIVIGKEKVGEGQTKKGRCSEAERKEVREHAAETTSHGAAGQLTGSRSATRQEQ